MTVFDADKFCKINSPLSFVLTVLFDPCTFMVAPNNAFTAESTTLPETVFVCAKRFTETAENKINKAVQLMVLNVFLKKAFIMTSGCLRAIPFGMALFKYFILKLCLVLKEKIVLLNKLFLSAIV